MVLITALFLFAIAISFGWWAISYQQWVWMAPTFILAIIGLGLILRWTWAAYLWILIAASASIWWSYTTIKIYLSGWPEGTLQETVISLIPGGFLIIVCIAGGFVVYKKLKNGSYAP